MNKKLFSIAAASLLMAGMAVAQSSPSTDQNAQSTDKTSTASPMQSNTSPTGSSSPNPNDKSAEVKTTTRDQEMMNSHKAKDKNDKNPAAMPNTTTSRKDQTSTTGNTTGGSTSTPDYSNNPK